MIVAIACVLGAWVVLCRCSPWPWPGQLGHRRKGTPEQGPRGQPPAEGRRAFKRWGSAIETAIEDASRSSRRSAPRMAPSSRR